MKRSLIIAVVIWSLISLYYFQVIITLTEQTAIHAVYWLVDSTLMGVILYYVLSGKLTGGSERRIYLLIGLFIASAVPKLAGLPLLLLEDVYRLGSYMITGGYPGRYVPLSVVAAIVSLLLFLNIVYGMIRGKYRYQVRRIRLVYKDLPPAFDGLTITHLSDIHAGSLGDAEAVKRGIRLINEQESDLVLFTGDFVNNRAAELEPWKELFTGITAKSGKYSVLGNHDYGDYIPWKTRTEKAANLRHLAALQQEMGFRLLMNEHVTMEKDGQRIAIAGVENWGLRGFHQYGELDKAVAGLERETFTIMLSHDPSHWESEVLAHPKHVHLTLSGHTHGMQFGVELPGFRWSPVQYIYRQWAGRYGQDQQYIYVNRGFGFIGFPGRVGIRPEIAVITLVSDTGQ